jgi:DNA polymerase-4
MWKEFDRRRTPFHVWVSLSQLQPSGLQLALSLDADHERQRAILEALDRINARHGPGMIHLTASHAVRDTVPMRIAFTHIPDPSLEDNTPSTHAQR